MESSSGETSSEFVSPQAQARRTSWARKRQRRAKIAKMNAAKRAKAEESTVTEERESSEDEPQPSEDERESSESESDGETFDDDRAQSVFDDWMVSLRLDDRRMLAVILMESFKRRQDMNVKDAAQEAGSIVGFNEKTVRRYRNDFFANKGRLSERRQGKYERQCIYHNEEINQQAATWVKEHAFVKGKPNMTAHSFCGWVNDDLLPSVHLPPPFSTLHKPEDRHSLAASPRL